MNAFCDPPITTSSPQPSISSGMVPRPVMASTTRMASVLPTAAAMACTSCAAPVEVSDACTKTPLVAGSAASAASTCVGRDHLSVGRGEHVGVQPVGFGDFRPALAEFAGCADDDFVAVRKQVGNRARPSRRCPRRRNISTSFEVPITSLRSARHERYDLAEIFRAMMDVRRHHGVQSGRIERRRPRCQ